MPSVLFPFVTLGYLAGCLSDRTLEVKNFNLKFSLKNPLVYCNNLWRPYRHCQANKFNLVHFLETLTSSFCYKPFFVDLLGLLWLLFNWLQAK